jgi:polysaccharide transporter, PST family
MAFILKRISRSVTAKNAISLYFVQGVNVIQQLFLLLYLARVLLPEGLGIYLFFYSLSSWLFNFVEYGFLLSGTREISRTRNDTNVVAKISSNILGVQLFISIVLIVLNGIAFLTIPIFHKNPLDVIFGLMFAIGRGFGPWWFFQGMEQMQIAAIFETVGKLSAIVLVFFVVRSAEQGWLALALLGLTSVLVTTLQIFSLSRKVKLSLPTKSAIFDTLRNGWSLFIFRVSSSLYTTANLIILGMISSPVVVSYFGGAERIIRGLLTLISPISNALYPRVSYQLVHTPKIAWRTIRYTVFAYCIGGFVLSACFIMLAPFLVRILFGSGYEGIVPIFRILSLLFPLVATNNAGGIVGMLTMGLEKRLNSIVISAGILNLLLSVPLTLLWSGSGMAIASVTVEGFVTLGVCFFLLKAAKSFQAS